METDDQKRNLGICSCVGTMIEYWDEKRRNFKKASRAYVANLSLNTDKTSYATLQHLLHSLRQSPIREILQKRSKVEICHDNARGYISRQFIYGVTKTLSKEYPHLKLIR